MSLPAQDDFVGGASALAGSWTQSKSVITLNRDGSGNAVSSSGSDEGYVFWNADTFSPDQYSEATIASGLGSGTGYVQPTARNSADVGDSARDCYQVYTDGVTGAGHTEISKVTNGTGVVLKSVAATFASSDRIGIFTRTVGTTVVVSMLKNGIIIDSVIDSTSPFLTGVPGLGAYGTGKIAFWEGGNLLVTAHQPWGANGSYMGSRMGLR